MRITLDTFNLQTKHHERLECKAFKYLGDNKLLATTTDNQDLIFNLGVYSTQITTTPTRKGHPFL